MNRDKDTINNSKKNEELLLKKNIFEKIAEEEGYVTILFILKGV
jgi:hypothetical protein